MNVPSGTIRRWATSEGWYDSREVLRKEHLKELTQDQAYQLSLLIDDTVGLITQSVNKAKEKGDGIPIKEIPKYTTALTELYKIFRLSTGQSTEVTENRNADVKINLTDAKNIKKIIQNDPFLQLDVKPADADEHDAVDAEFSTDDE